MKKDFAYFLRKSYLLPLVFTLILTFGYSLIHIAMGVDDFYRPWYTQDGNYLGGGRFGTYLIMLLLGPKGQPNFFMELTGMLIWGFCAILACILFRRASSDRLPFPAYIIFSVLFVSAPINVSQWVFADTGFAIKVGYCLVLLSLLMMDSCFQTKQFRRLITAILCLTFAIGIYQTLAAVFVVFSCCYLTLRELFPAEESCVITPPRLRFSLLRKGLLLAGVLMCSILIQTLLAKSLQHIFSIATFDAGTQSMAWFNGSRTFSERLIRVFQKILLHFGIASFFAPPITILCLSFLSCIFLSFVYGKRHPWVILALAGATLSLVLMFLVRGGFIGWRTYQGADCYAAFMFMLLFVFLSEKKPGGIAAKTFLALCCCLALFQAAFSHSGFQQDYLRWDYEKTLLKSVYRDISMIEGYHDHAVVFVSSGKAYPEETDAYADSRPYPQFMDCSLPLYDWLYGRLDFLPTRVDLYEYPYLSIGNAVNHESGCGRQLFHIYDYLGCRDLRIPTPEQYEAGQAAAESLPPYPQPGCIQKVGDSIVVKLS